MIEKLIALAPSVYEGNKARGFWEQGQQKSKGEAVMLMITELSEAVEAHRKGKVFDPIATPFSPVPFERWRETTRGTVAEYNEIFAKRFRETVKDSVADEIADATIRILDFCGGFGIEILPRDYRKESTGNFSADLLRITSYCINALHTDSDFAIDKGFIAATYHGKDWGYVLAAIIKFCEWYSIDLLKHIEWKLKYNSTREYKHGKKY